jgi:hypothetical protein
MSLQDFRRIALAHDLLAQSAPKRPDTAAWAGPDSRMVEPPRERIPAETASQEGNG